MTCRGHHRGYVVLDERAQEIRSVTSWSPQPRNLPAARSMHLAWAVVRGAHFVARGLDGPREVKVHTGQLFQKDQLSKNVLRKGQP